MCLYPCFLERESFPNPSLQLAFRNHGELGRCLKSLKPRLSHVFLFLLFVLLPVYTLRTSSIIVYLENFIKIPYDTCSSSIWMHYPLMPQGVEHEHILIILCGPWKMHYPLMPQGVEHSKPMAGKSANVDALPFDAARR